MISAHILDGAIQVLQLVAPLPFVYVLIDYGIVRQVARTRDGRRKYDPFWWTGLGIVFFLMTLSTVMYVLRVYLTLWFGDADWIQIVRLAAFIIQFLSSYIMLMVYLLEKRSPWMMLAPKELVREQKQAWQEIETSRGKAAREAYLKTHPHEKKPRTGPIDKV